jgi:hypothetical protein
VIEQIALVQLDFLAKMFNALKVLRAGTPDHAAHSIAFV